MGSDAGRTPPPGELAGAPHGGVGVALSGIGGGAVLTLVWVGVIGAGFALPRDAGRRPALQLSPSLTLAWGGVIGAGFALPRDAGRRPALQPSPRSFTIGDVGMGRRHWRWFRASARCRSETGAPSRPRALSQSLTLVWVGVIGAGFALPRDAGRRPALQLSQSLTLAWGGVIGAGFALPRDAGRRPALQPSPRSFTIGDVGMGRRHWRWFRASARCRSETGAPSRPRALSQSLTLVWVGVIGAGFALPRDAGRRPALQLSPSLTLAGGGVIGAGFALPRDAGRRPALQALSQSATLAWVGVIGAGFALPRDAGRRPALQLSQSAVRGFTSPRTQKAQRQPERRANCGPRRSRWPGQWLQIAPRRNSPSGRGRFHCAATSNWRSPGARSARSDR